MAGSEIVLLGGGGTLGHKVFQRLGAATPTVCIIRGQRRSFAEMEMRPQGGDTTDLYRRSKFPGEVQVIYSGVTTNHLAGQAPSSTELIAQLAQDSKPYERWTQ